MPGFCKIYRMGISNIILIYFLLSKHFPLKMVFHTQNISSFHCVPRTPVRTQTPCLKHHFLPSLLQSTHSPVEGGLHGSIKAAERKHLNLNKAFHLSDSTDRPNVAHSLVIQDLCFEVMLSQTRPQLHLSTASRFTRERKREKSA